MQTPTLVFSHVAKASFMLKPGPSTDERAADLAKAQRDQVTLSGRPAK